jgi:hypothetical protein
MNVKRKSGLGNNPLASAPTAKGIFQKTESINQNPESEIDLSIGQVDTGKCKPESRKWIPARCS